MKVVHQNLIHSVILAYRRVEQNCGIAELQNFRITELQNALPVGERHKPQEAPLSSKGVPHPNKNVFIVRGTGVFTTWYVHTHKS